MKKYQILIASAALMAAVAVGYSATRSPVTAAPAQDTCPGGCPGHAPCDCSTCDCGSCAG